MDHAALVGKDAATIALAVRFDSKEAYDKPAADPMQDAWYREHQAPHLDGEVRWIDGTWHDISSPGVLVAEELGRCLAEQRFDQLAQLYAGDAEFELHVGDGHDRRTGRDQIRDRYAQDFAIRPEFLRWEPVATARGAIIQADAHQDSPAGGLRFRWIHVLDALVEHGGHMHVLMGIDAAGHRGCLVMRDGCHRHSLFVLVGCGTHRPGGRTGQ